MLTFSEEKAGFSFYKENLPIAVGFYESSNFHLLYQDQVYCFSNALKAFAFLNDREYALSRNCFNSKTQNLLNLLKI